jgi:hypothetical protein
MPRDVRLALRRKHAAAASGRLSGRSRCRAVQPGGIARQRGSPQSAPPSSARLFPGGTVHLVGMTLPARSKAVPLAGMTLPLRGIGLPPAGKALPLRGALALLRRTGIASRGQPAEGVIWCHRRSTSSNIDRTRTTHEWRPRQPDFSRPLLLCRGRDPHSRQEPEATAFLGRTPQLHCSR